MSRSGVFRIIFWFHYTFTQTWKNIFSAIHLILNQKDRLNKRSMSPHSHTRLLDVQFPSYLTAVLYRLGEVNSLLSIGWTTVAKNYNSDSKHFQDSRADRTRYLLLHLNVKRYYHLNGQCRWPYGVCQPIQMSIICLIRVDLCLVFHDDTLTFHIKFSQFVLIHFRFSSFVSSIRIVIGSISHSCVLIADGFIRNNNDCHLWREWNMPNIQSEKTRIYFFFSSFCMK